MAIDGSYRKTHHIQQRSTQWVDRRNSRKSMHTLEINIHPSSSKPESGAFTLHGKVPRMELGRLERRF